MCIIEQRSSVQRRRFLKHHSCSDARPLRMCDFTKSPEYVNDAPLWWALWYWGKGMGVVTRCHKSTKVLSHLDHVNVKSIRPGRAIDPAGGWKWLCPPAGAKDCLKGLNSWTFKQRLELKKPLGWLETHLQEQLEGMNRIVQFVEKLMTLGFQILCASFYCN